MRTLRGDPCSQAGGRLAGASLRFPAAAPAEVVAAVNEGKKLREKNVVAQKAEAAKAAPSEGASRVITA